MVLHVGCVPERSEIQGNLDLKESLGRTLFERKIVKCAPKVPH